MDTSLINQLRPELKVLLSPKGNVTKAFAIKFLDLLPEEDLVMEVMNYDFSGDRVDYISWGYALTGEWEEMEMEAREVWAAVDKYKL